MAIADDLIILSRQEWELVLPEFNELVVEALCQHIGKDYGRLALPKPGA